MNPDFSRSLSLLRQERGLSQRQVAKELGISQALLSHYENGIREPGLNFVVKACDFYNVSADFLLGRTLSRDGTTILDADTLYDASAANYLSTSVYQLYRHLCRSSPSRNDDFFSVPDQQFIAGLPQVDMILSEAEYTDALANCGKDTQFPPMSHTSMTENYPGTYQSLLQIVHSCGERINAQMEQHKNVVK